jgi:hypothetical protein
MAEALGVVGRATATLRSTPGSLVVALPGHPEVPVLLGQGGVTEAVTAPTGPAGPGALELRDSRGRALVVLAQDAWQGGALDDALATAGVRRRDYTRRATPSAAQPLVLWPVPAQVRRGAGLVLVQVVTAIPAGAVALVGAVRTRVDDGYGPGSAHWPTDGWLFAAALLAAVASGAGLLRMRRTPDRPEVIAGTGQTGVLGLVVLGVALQRHAATPAVLAGVLAAVAIGAGLTGWWRLRRLAANAED